MFERLNKFYRRIIKIYLVLLLVFIVTFGIYTTYLLISNDAPSIVTSILSVGFLVAFFLAFIMIKILYSKSPKFDSIDKTNTQQKFKNKSKENLNLIPFLLTLFGLWTSWTLFVQFVEQKGLGTSTLGENIISLFLFTGAIVMTIIGVKWLISNRRN